MNRREPTTEERKALQRIEAFRTRMPLVALSAGLPILALQALPERDATIVMIVAIPALLCQLAALVYWACCLRCPRCAGWIAIPKCPSCGLALDEHQATQRRRA